MPVFPYNPAAHEYSKSFEKLPAGWYPAVIFESEILPTAAGNGFRLILKYKIIDGPGKDRIVQGSHNIQNPSPKAVEISMSELKTINACIGNYQPINQSEEMHNKPMQIRLSDPKDGDYNEVKGWKTINGEDPSKGGQGAPDQHQQQPPQGFGNAPAAPQAMLPYGAPPQQGQPQYAAPAYGQPAPQQYAQQPQAPPTAPAWAPPQQPAQYQQQPQQAPVPQQQTGAAPAWTPGAQPPAAPAWAPPRQ
jgi:hypothetical protein